MMATKERGCANCFNLKILAAADVLKILAAADVSFSSASALADDTEAWERFPPCWRRA
jgi:hypothetical protein